MQIVTQSAFLSYSPFPSRPLLTAPTPPKLLCAPKIAGLLPASVTAPKVEIIRPNPLSRDELLRQLGPIHSRDAMNAELGQLVLEALQFLAGNASRSVECSMQDGVR